MTTDPTNRTTTSKALARVGNAPAAARCGAKTRNGGTCQKWPIAGTNRCRLHGGASPQARKAARLRLMAMLSPALVQLAKIVDKPDTSDADRLRAIAMIMDRTGLSAEVIVKEMSLQIQLDAERAAESAPWEKLLSGVTAEGVAGIVWGGSPSSAADREAAEADSREQAISDGEIIEAEIVSETPPRPPASREPVRVGQIGSDGPAPPPATEVVVPAYLARIIDDQPDPWGGGRRGRG